MCSEFELQRLNRAFKYVESADSPPLSNAAARRGTAPAPSPSLLSSLGIQAGSHARVDSLEIWWPSGLRESVSELPVEVFLTIEEGTGKALARRYAPRKK
jgi:hypothetical protein